jgi:deazaflavin-dependent oxidoreductase (nitroreductase family)
MDTPAASGPCPSSARPVTNFPLTLYRWMRRRMRSRMGSAHILLLTTIGHDSGEPQTVALGYLEDGPDLVVVASNNGSDQHPTWYLNLSAHPQVGVQVEENLRKMVASTASPAARTHLLVRLAAEGKQHGRHQRDTAREIPIVLLRPA